MVHLIQGFDVKNKSLIYNLYQEILVESHEDKTLAAL